MCSDDKLTTTVILTRFSCLATRKFMGSADRRPQIPARRHVVIESKLSFIFLIFDNITFFWMKSHTVASKKSENMNANSHRDTNWSSVWYLQMHVKTSKVSLLLSHKKSFDFDVVSSSFDLCRRIDCAKTKSINKRNEEILKFNSPSKTLSSM